MVVVVFVELGVELGGLAAPRAGAFSKWTHQIQNRHFHHALIKVGGSVLDDLDGDDFLRLEVLALDDLSKGSLAEDVENEVAVPTGG